jgi:hypothetical protein
VQCWSFASNCGYGSRFSTPRESNKWGLNLVGCRRRSGRLLTHKVVIKILVAGYGPRIPWILKLAPFEQYGNRWGEKDRSNLNQVNLRACNTYQFSIFLSVQGRSSNRGSERMQITLH